MFLYKFLQTLLWIPGKFIFPTKVVGKKNLPKGGAVLICNHQSKLDIAIIGLSIYKHQYFLAKQEIFQKKSKARFYKIMGAIPIDREKPQFSSIKQCLTLLKNEKRLLVFPEGTRKQENTFDDIKNGAVMFAVKSQKPIVPMWIQKKPRFFGFNKLQIGEPIYLDNYYGKKLTEQDYNEIDKIICQKIKNLKK